MSTAWPPTSRPIRRSTRTSAATSPRTATARGDRRAPVRFDTRLVHVGQEPQPGIGGVVPPIHVATTYDRREQDPPQYFYGRGENPTREGLERCLASLEDARFA